MAAQEGRRVAVGHFPERWARKRRHTGRVLRLLVAAVILALLARALRPAWRNRRFALRVWSSIRPRHVLGSLALLSVVLGVVLTLLAYVPLTRVGLGTLVGLSGNAVFAPVEEAAVRSQQAGGGGGQVLLLIGTGAFLVLLLALFPELAHREELAFRQGLERAGPGRELWAALRFGLAHLVMLVPLAAALAIAVAGFAYGRVYRRAYATASAQVSVGDGGPEQPVSVRAARAEAVFAATVWHTTFNSLVVGLVFASLALGGA